MKKRVVAVILAAGRAERMGSLKQLLPYGSKTVIETVVDMMLETSVDDIIVVLGHQADEVGSVLSDRSVRFVVNSSYRTGMFSSVLSGLEALGKDVDGMMLMLGDQPQIRGEVVDAVLDRFRKTDKGIAMPQVEGHRGHPVIIDVNRYGVVIQDLDGSEGLKPIVRGYPDDTELVFFDDPSILRDMDTLEDYELELKLREKGFNG